MKYTCKYCGKDILPESQFCMHCGKENIPDPSRIQTLSAFRVYLMSVLLAPIGLYWFFKYRNSENLPDKKLAYAALYITIAVLLFSFIASSYVINSFSGIMSDFDSQYQNYEVLL